MTESRSPKLVVVPHTHWDREWYEPFEVFRLRLVHHMDRLLDILEAEPDYKFTLDGQSVMITDYLEMRPENRERLERAVRDGQLSVGPLLILLDEFACEGETTIRNLEQGLALARQVGPESRLAYLPDLFGHTAQMPQILRGFGIGDAAMWRGVPGAVEDAAFFWESPDGSRVRCQYMFDGYGSGLDLFAVPGQLPELATQYTEDTASWFKGDDTVVFLGSDHTPPMGDLLQRIAAENLSGAPEIMIETFDEYVARQDKTKERPTVHGEMRSHARGNLLPGVFSVRTNLKQAMANAERDVTIAERLDTLFPNLDNQAFLDTAWRRIIESTAHDSVTGCGADSTARQVMARLESASHIATTVGTLALEHAAKNVSAADHLVVNPSGFARTSLVEVRTAGDPPAGAQIVESFPTTIGDEVMTTADLPRILRRIHGRELFGQQINSVEWGDHTLTFQVAEVPVGTFDLARLSAEIEQRLAETPLDDQWKVLTTAAPRYRVLGKVALGGTGIGLLEFVVETADPVEATENGLKNEALTVNINEDGTVDIFGDDFETLGALAISDEGDRGDSYNFGPLASEEPKVTPNKVEVKVLESGPLRARVAVNRTWLVGKGISDGDKDERCVEQVEQVVTTTLELRTGEDFLRVRTELINQVPNHRMRMLVPVGHRGVDQSYSSIQYGVTNRGRTSEGGWGEYPLPTFPGTQFVGAGDMTVLVDKLTEYEVVTPDEGVDVLALTLVRAVGMMSVNIHPLRDEPAGSEVPVPEAQYLGERVVTDFALLPSPRGWEAAGAPKRSDLFRLPVQVVRGRAPIGETSVLPVPATAVETAGEVPMMSLRNLREDSHLVGREARFVNYSPNETELHVLASGNWKQVQMSGQAVSGGNRLGSGSDGGTIPGSTIWTFREPAKENTSAEGGQR